MAFQDFEYDRPDTKRIEGAFKELTAGCAAARTAGEQIQAVHEINELRNGVESAAALAYIRHTINTNDPFYDAENDYLDGMMPVYTGWVDEFYRALDGSPFKGALKDAFGGQFFNILEARRKAFAPEIVEDLKRENQLASRYTKLKASARITFDGAERNLSQMEPFCESTDPSIRQAAQRWVSGFYEEHEGEFDHLYDELVEVRHTMAQKLGFANFIPLGYLRLARTDYGPREVAAFRRQVLRDLVPLATSLREQQRERLGLDRLAYYDEPVAFTSGNAVPKGPSQWIIDRGRAMYTELSPQTETFINFMLDNGLMDLETKKGKAGGGYCHYINEHKAPFIFSNFNGTSDDIDVLTHEAGHAFQVFHSRKYDLPEYIWPTLEACEIHSMSMEFLTWPWMKNFFLEDEMKYKFIHLSKSLFSIPYGVLVDEFQHFVYESPLVPAAERKEKWRELEKKYLPHRQYPGNPFLERGGYWFRQAHIFTNPFYYIDYTLAQVCAFQFFIKSLEDHAKAWEDYVRLCDRGGSLPFLELLKVAGLRSPFEEGSLQRVIPPLTAWLFAQNIA